MPPKKNLKNLKSNRKGRKSGRKIMVAKKAAPITYTGVKKLIDNRILRKAETKNYYYNFGKTELYHNTVFFQILNDYGQMPSQGTGDTQRIGDNVNIQSMYLRILCGQKKDRPNVTWRFFVVKVPKASTMSYATIFLNVTGNALLDTINRDKCKVLKSFTLKPNMTAPTIVDATTTKEFTFPVKFYVPYKKLYRFQTDGGLTHNDDDIYFMCVCYDAYGSLVTDNICYIQLTNTIYFKDP